MFVAGFIGTPSMNFVDATLLKQDDKHIVDAGSFKVAIPASKNGKNLDAYIGKPVVFGIRPEDIFDKNLSSLVTPTEDNTIKAMVDVIEPMGAIVTMYLTSGPHSLIGTIDAESKAKEDQEIGLVLDMDKTHLFDKQTEILIY